MCTFLKRRSWAALAGAAALGLAPSEAGALGPHRNWWFNLAAQRAAYANGFAAGTLSGGSGGDDLGSYLGGVADIIGAEGRALVNIEQSKLLHEEVRRERLENHRRAFDQYLYFRLYTPTPEDDRQKELRELLRRSLNDPPSGDITSGWAQNTLLADIQKKGSSVQGPDIPLRNDILRHINVTSPRGAGNPGLLKNEGRLTWPVVLRGRQYKEEHDVLNDLTPAAYDQAVAGKSDAVTLERMAAAVRRLEDKLRDNSKDLTPTMHSEGWRFLTDFEAALSLLRRPDAGDYFTHNAPRAKTVAELVQHMTTKGLIFAPAVAGDENAYLALQRALAAYDAGVNLQMSGAALRTVPTDSSNP